MQFWLPAGSDMKQVAMSYFHPDMSGSTYFIKKLHEIDILTRGMLC